MPFFCTLAGVATECCAGLMFLVLPPWARNRGASLGTSLAAVCVACVALRREDCAVKLLRLIANLAIHPEVGTAQRVELPWQHHLH
jgi:hypothetical protein